MASTIGSTLLAACSLVPSSCSQPHGDNGELVVFAAASLRDALSEVGRAWTADGNGAITFNFAGSNVLARQIEATPCADVFVSADRDWIDHVERLARSVPGSRVDLLANRLVVVGRGDGGFVLGGTDDLVRADFDHLALGHPRAVPAGRYARAWLEAAGAWEALAERVVPTVDVRAALALAASDARILAVVYATDAAISRDVQVLLLVPETDHERITYCAVEISRDTDRADDAAHRFLDYLSGPDAARVFERHGFTHLGR